MQTNVFKRTLKFKQHWTPLTFIVWTKKNSKKFRQSCRFKTEL